MCPIVYFELIIIIRERQIVQSIREQYPYSMKQIYNDTVFDKMRKIHQSTYIQIQILKE